MPGAMCHTERDVPFVLKRPRCTPTVQGGRESANAAQALDSSVCPNVPAALLGANSLEGQASVVHLLRALGAGRALLAQYKSREAIEAFSALPCQHYQTSWVLSHVGRAYFEMVDYGKACEFFRWSRKEDPFRLDGMEWYSTVLWHMKKEARCSTKRGSERSPTNVANPRYQTLES